MLTRLWGPRGRWFLAFLGLGEDPIWVRFGHPLPHHVMQLRMHFHSSRSCQSRAKGTNSPWSRSATYCGDGSHGTGYVFRGMKWYLLKTKASPNGHWMWLQQENQQWAKLNWKSTFSKEIQFLEIKKSLTTEQCPSKLWKGLTENRFWNAWIVEVDGEEAEIWFRWLNLIMTRAWKSQSWQKQKRCCKNTIQ